MQQHDNRLRKVLQRVNRYTVKLNVKIVSKAMRKLITLDTL